jgi:DNA-binding beta-propeller fold protein YncE
MKRLLVATAVALVSATSADAQTFKQVARIEIPGTPIENYGVLAIDQATGLGYLADKDNKAVVVFDTKTDKYVTRIGGFVGMTRSGNTSGPNGLAVVNGELWVSDGDSTVKVIDLQSGKIAATIHTGGTSRANAMAFDPKNQVVIVANSNDECRSSA